ncbi:MAG: oligosaccharide flippase family protein, partial [Anaerolineaceae bacterium]|nr:oligosaccharide flippase family protein [Anaerolineaceae bacterium]
VYALLLARTLSPGGYGLFAGTYAIAGLSSFLFNWGLDTWLLRHCSLDLNPISLVAPTLLTKTILGIVWIIGLVTVLPQVQPGTYLRGLTMISCLDVFSEGLFTVQIAALNAMNRFKEASGFVLLSRGGRLMGAVCIILVGVQNPILFAGARWFATLISLAAISMRLHPPIFTIKTSYLVRNFTQSVPYGFSDLLSAIYLQADVSLLALISGNRVLVGTYSPASGLINALFVIPSAFYSVMLPVISRQINAQSLHLQHNLKKMFGGFAMLGLTLGLGILLASRPMTSILLGQQYLASSHLIAILSPILFLKSIEFGCVVVLVASGWQKHRLLPQIVSAGINILLNIILIPILGVIAVAYVYVISEILLAAGYVWVTFRWMRLIRLPKSIG